ncbi:ATP-binding cassette transporter [Trichuris trichiura]|uniref:ATP-binding cassette transporter n=1 Tax=Trichuris trichiura TaxID=36087 RepID=A0A077ZCX6_TRITR|nr:ATP-binding cassette transporter [Trichuris trichiura]
MVEWTNVTGIKGGSMGNATGDRLTEKEKFTLDERRCSHKEIKVNVALAIDEDRLDPARFTDLEKLL